MNTTSSDRMPAARAEIPADVHELPQVVVGAADLDNLELALNQALPAGAGVLAGTAELAAAPRIVITDAENTPLALFEADERRQAAGTVRTGRLRPLGPLPVRAGLAADVELRMPPARARATVLPASSHGATLAVVFSELPTTDDLRRARAEIERRRPRTVLWAALVSRSRAPAMPNDNAVARAVMALKPSGATGLIVPAPHDVASTITALQPGGVMLNEIMERYGAAETFDVGSARTAAERERLGTVAPEDADAVYPVESAREFLRYVDSTPVRGAVILFTGLSGSGKSTVAKALAERLESQSRRPITLLDGDEVRKMLSSELGFDRRSREINLRRIGYVAALVARSGGIAIAAPIAPFEASRQEIRHRVEPDADFLLVHVATPLAVCERRDRKGLYARARAGLIDDFTGVSSPYEPPENAHVVIDTSVLSIGESVDVIVAALARRFGEARSD